MPVSLNNNSQLFLPEKDRTENPQPRFCSRVLRFRLNRGRTLFLNSLSGAVDAFNNKELRMIEALEKGRGQLPPRLQRLLVDRRYLFASRQDEDAYFKQIAEMAAVADRIGFYIHVTSACNFSCAYCFEGESKKREMTIDADRLENIFKAISRITRALGVKPEGVLIRIFGGEPLLPGFKGTLEKILRYCQKKGYFCTITTNGFTLGSFIGLFSRYRQRIRYLHVSLDGPAAIHDRKRPLKNGGGTFERIVENVDRALKHGLRVLLRTNLDRQTLAGMMELVKFYQKMGWDKKKNLRLQIIPTFDMFDTSNRKKYLHARTVYREILPVLRYIAKEFRHPPAGNFLGPFVGSYLADILGVDPEYQEAPEEGKPVFQPQVYACLSNQLRDMIFFPDGKIYPCPVVAGKKNYAIGEYSPRLAFSAGKCENWRNRRVDLVDPCSQCKVANFCGGGCVISASPGNIPSHKVICGGFKGSLLRFLKKNRKLILKRVQEKEKS